MNYSRADATRDLKSCEAYMEKLTKYKHHLSEEFHSTLWRSYAIITTGLRQYAEAGTSPFLLDWELMKKTVNKINECQNIMNILLRDDEDMFRTIGNLNHRMEHEQD